MREEPNLFEGKSVVLEHPDDLQRLRPALAAVIPIAVRALFVGQPTTLRSLAREAVFPPLAGWLRRVARDGCELAIHRPGRRIPGPSHEVFLQVGDPGNPVLFSGSVGAVPRRCPPALAEVLRRVGIVRGEYGGAAGLLHPSDHVDLPRLIEERWRRACTSLFTPEQQREVDEATYDAIMGAGAALGMSRAAFLRDLEVQRRRYVRELRGASRPPRPSSYRAFYRGVGGDLVTVDRGGRTWILNDEAAGPPIEDWLAGFFRGLPAWPSA